MLIDGKKHDLRLYLMIKQAGKNDDFVAFLCEEGLARFCVEEYEEVKPADWKARRQQQRQGKVYTSASVGLTDVD